MRARTLAIIAMLGLAGTTAAGERLVYRCKDAASGHLSFQSQPCGRGQVQEATYDATPDEVSAKPHADRESRSSPASVPRGAGRGSRTSRPRSRAVAAVIGSSAKCKRERAARDKAYRTDFKMGYRERQSWGERVRKACK